MSGVEAIQPNTSGVIETNSNPSMDAELGAVFDRLERDNGSARDEGGRFVSANPEPSEGQTEQVEREPLEGGAGEGQAEEISTPSVDVPLPANMLGLEETWGKIAPELRGPIAAHMEKLHKNASEQGRVLAAYKPIGDVIGKFKDYFGGTRGNYKPHEAIEFMFGLQQKMDDNPLETLMEIADRYELRPHLAKAFGAQAGQEGQQTDNTSALLAKIGQLENTIRQLNDPSRVDERITQRLTEDRQMSEAEQVINRVIKDTPLAAEVPQDDLVPFINIARTKLGGSASYEAVLKSAFDMAINADPELRKKAAALATAAATDPKKIADARKANEANIRSTSTGKPRPMTDEEELGQIWDKHKRA